MAVDKQVLVSTLERAKSENGGLDAMGHRFYERLFERYPAVRPLFTSPTSEQQKKLIASINIIVQNVDNTEKLLPYLKDMGARHVGYGTENAHYGAVKENLMAVMKEHLSKEGEWTDEMQSNWDAAIDVVAEVMIQGADEHQKAQA